MPFLAHWVDLARWLDDGGGFAPGSGGCVRWSRRRRCCRGPGARPTGLRQALEWATGVGGVRIEESSPSRPFHVVVTVPLAAEPQRELIERIVRQEKPAHVTAEVVFVDPAAPAAPSAALPPTGRYGRPRSQRTRSRPCRLASRFLRRRHRRSTGARLHHRSRRTDAPTGRCVGVKAFVIALTAIVVAVVLVIFYGAMRPDGDTDSAAKRVDRAFGWLVPDTALGVRGPGRAVRGRREPAAGRGGHDDVRLRRAGPLAACCCASTHRPRST